MSDPHPMLVARLKPCPKCGDMMRVEDIHILGQLRRMFVCQTRDKCGFIVSTYDRQHDEGEV